MAIGTRKDQEQQEEMWVPQAALAKGASHPFYQRLNQRLEESHFDEFVEGRCRRFYAQRRGRPSLAPGVYFRLLLIGYFEGIDSERGIAWRANDSLALRRFLRVGLDETPPDHSTISRTRRLIDVETHREVFTGVLGVLAEKGLQKGQTLGVDATTLEANAALRTIVRRDTGEGYQEFLKRLAQESGIKTPTREQLARLDRKRAHKGSNEEWEHPHDPEARIAKMKDGRTHLAHKVEHAVDFSSGAVVAVTVQPADAGDTATGRETGCEAGEQIATVAGGEKGETVNPQGPKEVVLDKGYHSNEVRVELADWQVRSYCSEPDRGRRCWEGKKAEQAAVYAHRRRIRSERGKQLLRQRGEKVERSFAHCYETGGMRRLHLRHHPNILKRLLVHVAAFNLGLVMRKLLGRGTPRGLQGYDAALFFILLRLLREVGALPVAWKEYAESQASVEPSISQARLQSGLCSPLRIRPFPPRAARRATLCSHSTLAIWWGGSSKVSGTQIISLSSIESSSDMPSIITLLTSPSFPGLARSSQGEKYSAKYAQ
jgi:transposase